jgi:hypothetical protein
VRASLDAAFERATEHKDSYVPYQDMVLFDR